MLFRSVYTYFNSGGQGHLMPVAVDPKSSRLSVSVRHGDGSITVECHRVPQAAQPSATRPWIGPRATRGPMSWSAGTQRSLPGKHLAGALILPGPGACHSPGPCRGAYSAEACLLVFLASSSCQGLVLTGQSRAWYGLPGKLLLPGSCLLSLNTLFLDGSKGILGGSWHSPSKPLPWGAATARAQVRGTRVPLI